MRIVALIGSNKNYDLIEIIRKKMIIGGDVVLSNASDTVAFDIKGDKEKEKELQQRIYKANRKIINLASEIYIVNPLQKIGDGTRYLLDFARSKGKSISWMKPPLDESHPVKALWETTGYTEEFFQGISKEIANLAIDFGIEAACIGGTDDKVSK